MSAPQSDVEVRPVVEALQRLDPRLDLLWNPKSIMVAKGSYDALGKNTPPTYAGRWEVIQHEVGHGLSHDRSHVLITRVCECDWSLGFPRMQEEGPYAPVGQWLVDFMNLWDRANSAAVAAMAKSWEDHDRNEAIEHDRAANQEAAERVYREHGGGEYWMGGAQGKAHPTTLATLFKTVLTNPFRRSAAEPTPEPVSTT